MSLVDSLRGAIRTRLPDETLKICQPHDRQVVENVILVLCEYTSLDISRAHVDRRDNDKTYVVTIPVTTDMDVSLSDLRQVESFSPSRVLDLRVCMKTKGNHVQVVIADETHQVLVAECDVLRVRKRRRWWGL